MNQALEPQTAHEVSAPDMQAAQQFLESLGGTAFTFQTFDDNAQKRSDLVRVLHGTLEQHGAELAALNALGAGVFITVNETDGKGRKQENITRARGVFADFDNQEAAGIRLAGIYGAMGIEPTLVVESSPDKHHAYWLTDGLALEEFQPLQASLIERLGSDPKVKGKQSVMRLPGFFHRKGAPFMVRAIHEGARVNVAAIRSALDTCATQEAPEKPRETPQPSNPGDVSPYARKALEGACSAILTAPEGARNDTLNREAFGLFGLVKGAHLREYDARLTLEKAARGAGLSEGETRDTLESAWRAAEPRDIPQRADKMLPIMDTGHVDEQPATEQDNGPAFAYTMAGDMVDHLKPIDWLVKGFLEADSLGLIYGPPKCGKSFLAIDWACSIATGTDWQGGKVKQGTVFYLAGEGHNGLSRRLVSWSLARGVSLKDAPLAISNRAAPLTDRPSAAMVAQAINHLSEQTGQKPAVIIVDTLARNFGADENSTQDMNTFVQHLDEIRAKWNCTVLVVHHTGKDKSRGARGSVALTGAIDAGYSVDRDELGNITLEPTEMKDAELPEPRSFKLEGVKLPLVDEDGNDVWGARLEPLGSDYQPPKRGSAGRGKNQTLALSKLAELKREHQDRLTQAGRDPDEARVTITDWREACRKDCDINAKRWPEVRGGLEKAGLVEVIEPYAYYTG